jgi:Pectate lyase superfamily protein
MTFRSTVPDFELANPLYIGAQVFFFTVDGSEHVTTTLATLFADPTSTQTLANPQTLDSEGKFLAPVYIEVPVIANVVGATVGSHTTGIIGLYPTLPLGDYANPVWWGADPTGVSDSTAAFNSALAASSVVKFPAGTFKFNSQIAFTMPYGNGTFGSITIEGAGSDLTQLIWPNASGGIVITLTFNAFQSTHLANLSLVTSQASGGTAYHVSGAAAPVVTPVSSIDNVTIRGAGYTANALQYWTYGIDWETAGNVSLDNLTIYGSTNGGTSHGLGINLHGTSVFGAGPMMVVNSNLIYLNIAVNLGQYNQAFHIQNSNLFSGAGGASTGIFMPGGLGTATTGLVLVNGCEFGSFDFDINLASGAGVVIVSNNFFVSAASAAVVLELYYDVAITGNVFQGNALGLAIGIPQGAIYYPAVTGNFFITNTNAIELGNSASTISAVGNSMHGNSNNFFNQSTVADNYIAGNPGYNPVGVVSSTTYAVASTVTYHGGPTPENHFLTGGTVTAVHVPFNASVIMSASTPCMVPLPANGTFSVTYSVAPQDMVWVQ